jgi:hypothetical protein
MNSGRSAGVGPWTSKAYSGHTQRRRVALKSSHSIHLLCCSFLTHNERCSVTPAFLITPSRLFQFGINFWKYESYRRMEEPLRWEIGLLQSIRRNSKSCSGWDWNPYSQTEAGEMVRITAPSISFPLFLSLFSCCHHHHHHHLSFLFLTGKLFPYRISFLCVILVKLLISPTALFLSALLLSFVLHLSACL